MAKKLSVHCVYGESNLPSLVSALIPSLEIATTRDIDLFTINYNPQSIQQLDSGNQGRVTIHNIVNPKDANTGFAENHNILFGVANPDPFFVIINPDCIATEGCFDKLIETKVDSAGPIGIVESRQWPFDHPKEYDMDTFDTPWASGACALIDSEFYRQIGGMAEEYFMYCEDVDLSWQAWINGYRVLYQPESVVMHFSGGPFYDPGEVPAEVVYSLCNYIALSRKFFGTEAESAAIARVRQENEELAAVVVNKYLAEVKPKLSSDYVGIHPPQVKIVGMNQYHELRA